MKYLTLAGKKTISTDPKRGVWYSANCYYWTDDWSKLKLRNGRIPCCPECGTPGLQMTADQLPDPAPVKERCKPPTLTSWLGNAS